MKTKLLKNIVLPVATAMLAVSCSGLDSQNGVTQSIGDAAVDSVTKDTDPITKAAIRNQTGYGTDPIQERTSGLLNSLGR